MLTALVIEKAGANRSAPSQADIAWLRTVAGIPALDDLNAAAFYGSSGANLHLLKVLEGNELIDPTPLGGYDPALIANLGIDQFEVQRRVFSDVNWGTGLTSYLTSLAVRPDQAGAVGHVILTFAVRSWSHALQQKDVNVSPFLAEMSGAITDFSESIANTNTELTAKHADTGTFRLPWSLSSFSAFNPIAQAFAQAAERPDLDPALAQILEQSKRS
jgi:hypothetical protein